MFKKCYRYVFNMCLVRIYSVQTWMEGIYDIPNKNSNLFRDYWTSIFRFSLQFRKLLMLKVRLSFGGGGGQPVSCVVLVLVSRLVLVSLWASHSLNQTYSSFLSPPPTLVLLSPLRIHLLQSQWGTRILVLQTLLFRGSIHSSLNMILSHCITIIMTIIFCMKSNSDSSHYIIILFKLHTLIVHFCSVEKWNKVELNWRKGEHILLYTNKCTGSYLFRSYPHLFTCTPIVSLAKPGFRYWGWGQPNYKMYLQI